MPKKQKTTAAMRTNTSRSNTGDPNHGQGPSGSGGELGVGGRSVQQADQTRRLALYLDLEVGSACDDHPQSDHGSRAAPLSNREDRENDVIWDFHDGGESASKVAMVKSKGHVGSWRREVAFAIWWG